MSDILRIRTLTDRFFDGMTTLEEEQELYDYYRREQALRWASCPSMSA